MDKMNSIVKNRKRDTTHGKYEDRHNHLTVQHQDMTGKMNVEKHRPLWVRGLTATELDRRSEQARLMNHGQQMLLESRLGKLDQKERQSVKAITRSTEDMLASLRNIKVTSPPFSSERPASYKPYFTPPVTKRLTIVASRVCDDSTSSGDSSEDGAFLSSSPAMSSQQELHLPLLNVKGSDFSKRRYSANDALVKSIERFNAYKASLAKYSSSEAIDEQNASNLDEASASVCVNTKRDSGGISSNKIPMSRSASCSCLESQNITSSDKLPRPPVKDPHKSMASSRVRHVKCVVEDVPNTEPSGGDQSLSHSIDAVSAVNTHSEKASIPTVTRSTSYPFASNSVPVIRVTESKGKNDQENASENESEENRESTEEISIIISFPLKFDRSLRSARRRSMALQPATFRSLDHRRNSSPDVMGHPITYKQKMLLASNKTTSFNNRGHKSEEVDLRHRVKDFLERADVFKQSTSDLPKIDRNDNDTEN